MKLNYQNVSVLLGSIVAVTIIAGYLTSPIKWVDKRWAKAGVVQALAKEVDLVKQRLDQKILHDRINGIQERIWKLEDRYPNIEEMPSAVRDEYRRLIKELKELQEKLKEYG